MFDRHLMRRVAFLSFRIDSAFNFNDVTKKVDYRHLPLYLAIYARKGKHARATTKKAEKVQVNNYEIVSNFFHIRHNLT